MADLDSLLEQIEAEKNKPDILADKPVSKNPVGGESADSVRNRQAFLPSQEEHYKKTEELSRMVDTTARAGAGGTKAGLVGIRPSGGKAASQFLENFTGTGRMKKEKDQFENPVPIKDGPKLDVKRPSAVLYKRCADCRKRAKLDYAVPSLINIPYPPNLNPIEAAKWEAVGLRPGEILGFLYCVPCVKNAQQEAQKLNSTGLVLVEHGQQITPAQRYLKARGQSISDNIFAMLHAARRDPETDVFYGEARFR